MQQGNPQGPLGFALTLHPLIERIKSEMPDLALNVWYLDNGTLVGPLGDLAATLQIIEDTGPSLGLHLNRSKSLIHIPDNADASTFPLPAEIHTTRRDPAPPDYFEEVFRARVEKLKASLVALQDMDDSQLEVTFLHSCLALPCPK